MHSKVPRVLLCALAARVAELDRLRCIAESLYEPCTGSLVRRSDVAEMVAARLGVRSSPFLRRDLIASLRRAGWMTIRFENRGMWCDVKLRGLSDAQALFASKQALDHIRGWRWRGRWKDCGGWKRNAAS